MGGHRVVITEKKYPQDIPDEFYFSSPEKYGGQAHTGDQVVIENMAGNILAIGQIVREGKPHAECRTVQVTKRFE
jgi:hypothetical protein